MVSMCIHAGRDCLLGRKGIMKQDWTSIRVKRETAESLRALAATFANYDKIETVPMGFGRRKLCPLDRAIERLIQHYRGVFKSRRPGG